ncbi:MAG: hypothetical protein ACREH9_02600, partial [Pseudomonadota bacterium]
MAILARLLTLIIAYILACLAASIVLTVGTFVPQWPDPPSLDFSSAALWPVVGVGAAMIAGVAFLPVLLVITLAEGFAWRSILVYGA